MDTSSDRYAVAVLLDGRMGLVCDIALHHIRPQASPKTPTSTETGELPHDIPDVTSTQRIGQSSAGPFLDRVSLKSSVPSESASRAASTASEFPGPSHTNGDDNVRQSVDQAPATLLASRECNAPPHDHNYCQQNTPASNSPPNAPERTHNRSKMQFPAWEGTREMNEPHALPIETGPRSLYRNLCSEDDPPRSVAICPQRRCVAFGCSAGIELHWVDALTGQDLNRWFPLTAPSDHLYFLPPRRSIDSAKKLRLISSAAKPNERAAINERVFGGHTRSSPYWDRIAHFEERSYFPNGILGLSSPARHRESIGGTNSGTRQDFSDHYHAIPLSDGYHILFTDPNTGLLCLGSDAPVGGPTKLLRKIWFDGPEGAGSPVVYAAGPDLGDGVRVAAAYGTGSNQSVWLFSVPVDVFKADSSQRSMTSSSPTRSSASQEARNLEWARWWPDDGVEEWATLVQDQIPGLLPKTVWPIKIRGQRIGSTTSIVDLAVDAGADFSIWAFQKDAVTLVWKLSNGKSYCPATKSVVRDGTIQSASSGNNSVTSTPTGHEFPIFDKEHTSFDGTVSSGAYHDQLEPIVWNQVVNYDSDGDVIMTDIREVEQGVKPCSIHNVVAWTESSSTAEFTGLRAAMIEEQNGIARFDVEVR